ncbi:MAG: HisA/HisF-related TIM barrel protein [Fimbriiglobus sp.]|jgi:phosphoribosylformimino-5-aminoimidazole carboxamide ribotide isomerase|nr:HisA/HisF-related TIM barrel protein [Fimbriiglobus sp.]
MRIIPVIDVMAGVVVRAVGGKRADYRPVQSKLTASASPLGVAKALLKATGAEELYVADLDAITGTGGGTVGAELADALPGTRIWIDQGIRGEADIARLPLSKPGTWKNLFKPLPRANVVPVLGSETVGGPAVVASVRATVGSGCVFSIDTYDGELIGDWRAWSGWGVAEPTDVAALVRGVEVVLGNRVFILLDLAHVGSRSGPGTAKAVERLKAELPELCLVSGGGVRTADDVARLKTAGADAVLVASALHDGTLKL